MRSEDNNKNVNIYINNQAEANYSDLQENSRASHIYTELQTRNGDYSDIEAAGHVYVNTQLQS